MLHSMLRPLAERGHEVHVWESRLPADHTYKHDGFVLDGVHVHPNLGEDDDPFPMFMEKADVVISQLENTPRALIVSRFAGKPCFIINHNEKPHARAWMHEAGNVRHVYNSRWVAEALGNMPGSLIVRPPVYSDEYRTTPGDRVTLINLSPDKGAGIFYELAERMPNTKFLGVCGAYDLQVGPHKDLPNVEILPHTSDMRSVYERTRVLLMPSEYESWGRCAIEAAASGIPTIAADTPGLLEALDYAGTFRSTNSISGWEWDVKRLMHHEDEWLDASAAALRRSAELDTQRDADLAAWVEAVEGSVESRPSGDD